MAITLFTRKPGHSTWAIERLSRRLAEHVRRGVFTQDEVNSALRFAVDGGKLDREVAEQVLLNMAIEAENLTVLNTVNPIGSARQHHMPTE